MEYHKAFVKTVIGIAFVIFLVLVLTGCAPAPEEYAPKQDGDVFFEGRAIHIWVQSPGYIKDLDFNPGETTSVVENQVFKIIRCNPDDPDTIVFFWYEPGNFGRDQTNGAMIDGKEYFAIKVHGKEGENTYAVMTQEGDNSFWVKGYVRNLDAVDIVDTPLAASD